MVSAFGHQLFSLSLSALRNFQPVPGVGRLPVLPIEGKMPEWAEGVFNSAAKIQIYFRLFCKILLEYSHLSGIAVFFCVARENLRPRHAEIFSMPCAWRGVKENYSWQCVMSGSMARRLRRYDRFPQIPVPSLSPVPQGIRGFCILMYHHRRNLRSVFLK